MFSHDLNQLKQHRGAEAEGELKKLLRKIEQIKQEWEFTIDALSELVCLVDKQGRITRANRTVETWGLARVTEVKGRAFHELLHPGCADPSCYLSSFWDEAWEGTLRGQAAQCEAYDEALKRYVRVQVEPWKDWGKEATDGFTVVVVQDITERKQAEEALKEYSERLEEMVEERTQELQDAQQRLLRTERLATIGQLGASIAHELRNPLGIIKNSTYYVNMKLGHAEEKVRKHLEIIENEISRSNKIITNLMNFARDQKLTLQSIQINALVQQALSRTPMPDTVTVSTHLGDALPPLMADLSQIEQVFINLISNAVQAMTSPRPSAALPSTGRETGRADSMGAHEGGRLDISTRVENGFVAAEFKDEGSGISEENLEKIFEPLFTTKTKGIGLGLAVSKRIVEAHGGSIEVESEVGKGATFVVRLPVSANGSQSGSIVDGAQKASAHSQGSR